MVTAVFTLTSDHLSLHQTSKFLRNPHFCDQNTCFYQTSVTRFGLVEKRPARLVQLESPYPYQRELFLQPSQPQQATGQQIKRGVYFLTLCFYTE